MICIVEVHNKPDETKQKYMQTYALCIYDYEQTFVDVPHNNSVVNRSRNQEVSIPSPADVIHILYVSPKNK